MVHLKVGMPTSMTAKGPRGRLQLIPAESRLRPRFLRRWRSLLIPTVAALALILSGFLIAIAQNQRREALRNLPLERRAQLFRQSLTEVGSTCLESYAAQGALRDHCIEQAHFVLMFPECGPECRSAANAVLPHAHR